MLKLDLEEGEGVAPNRRRSSVRRINTIPYPDNPRFYGREKILSDLDAVLKPEEKHAQFSSVVLHALGGIGKTQIALKYARRKTRTTDVVLWVASENESAIVNAVTSIVTKALALEGARPDGHVENRILFLDWLIKTGPLNSPAF